MSQFITAVGVDVSKGKSMVAVRRPGGETVMQPFEVRHTQSGLTELAARLKGLDGDIRVVMEHTGTYWQPIAMYLKKEGFFVSVVNALLIHDFTDNSLRKVKTDKADSMKIANYALAFWSSLRELSAEDEIRQQLKAQSRLYERTRKMSSAMRNALIAVLDQTFPGANLFFSGSTRTITGHYKWVDFVHRFWHKDCVTAVSLNSFADTFSKWCKRTGYHFSMADAQRIHSIARDSVATLQKNDSTKLLVTQAADSLNAIYEATQALREEMNRLASMLPEYAVVMSMHGAGPITGSQLMAEIGDVRRFTHKGALVAYAGVDAPPYQSGTFDSKNRHVSKRGAPQLRSVLFLVCSTILKHEYADDPVYCFMDRKRAEGKHYYVYMVAGAAKFLRIYYAKVKESLAEAG